MKITKMYGWVLFLAFLCIYACKKTETTPFTETLDLSGRDTTMRPQDDFFSYANGNWVKNTEIPSDQSGWGSFYILGEENQKKTKTILEEAAAANAAKGSIQQKVGDFYASAMDTAKIEQLGYDPIKGELAKVDAIQNVQQMLDFLATQEYNRGGALFGMAVFADDKRSDINRLQFFQSGTGLPEKDYYFKNDDQTKAVRDAYVQYISNAFMLTGESDKAKAKQRANTVLKLETEFAKAHKSQVELRDPESNYHKFAVSEMSKQTPGINWQDFITKMNVTTDTILVGQPEYYIALDKLLKSTSIDVLKDKIRFSIIDDAANYLSTPFVQTKFEFNKVLSGQPELPERWKRAATQADTYLGFLLGQLWVQKYFPPEAKERMITLVNNLQIVYKKRLEQLDWMSPETKQKAIAKLDAFLKQIGYPDTWEDYSDVNIDRGNYYANIISCQKHNWNRDIAKIDKAVDKTEWPLTPPTVNAGYLPNFNSITFPAGILQPPFFDLKGDDAVVYGGIGAVIGHEMTHGFDDQGRQYDKDGNLSGWWTDEDAEKFNAKAQVVANQYNEFTVLDSLHVNGQLTLGENIADLGGVTLAYEAFKLTEQGKSNEIVNGLTPDQRFFMGYANIWRIKNRPEFAAMLINVDVHSPEKWRVNGPLTNFEPFYAAFGVKEGDKMYRAPSERAKIW